MEETWDEPLFGELNAAQPSSEGAWSRSLTHRARVLLHTTPLHDLRHGDAHVDQNRRHYDSLALALKVIDLIVENTGLEREIDRAAVTRALTPLLRAMDEAAQVPSDPEGHALMVDRVLGGLRNDDERRRPFSLTYQDFDAQGAAVSRRLEFRLVSDHFHPAGGTVLRLSSEAINLYLNALELDIEDAQAAAEAVVQSQLARGKFDEAVQSARNARLQSIRYQDKVDAMLRETRRDLRRVDWREEAPKVIAEALAHIKTRLDMERNILATAEDRRDTLAEEESIRKVTQVVSLVRECQLRHTELHERLMGARNVFLDEQARQSFTSTSPLRIPALEGETLDPLLRLDRRCAEHITNDGFALFFGARPVPVLSLVDLAAWQLRPRREQPTGEVPLAELDLAYSSFDLARFPAEIRAQVADLLAAVETPVLLSTLLEQAREAGERPEAVELLALTVLHHFAPEQIEPQSPRVARSPGEPLRAAGFFGDEMVIYPHARTHATGS